MYVEKSLYLKKVAALLFGRVSICPSDYVNSHFHKYSQNVLKFLSNIECKYRTNGSSTRKRDIHSYKSQSVEYVLGVYNQLSRVSEWLLRNLIIVFVRLAKKNLCLKSVVPWFVCLYVCLSKDARYYFCKFD